MDNIEDYLHDFGYLMQKTFFEYKEEEFFQLNREDNCVKNNLKRNVSFWEEIGASEFILDIIKTGYKRFLFMRRQSRLFMLIIVLR